MLVSIIIYTFTPAAAVAAKSSHLDICTIKNSIYCFILLAKRLSFILFDIWGSGSLRVCISKHKGIRAEITVKPMLIYKSDCVECNRQILLNIHEVMAFGETA